MFKHYVGEGAPEGGRSDHYAGGKYNVFPGNTYDFCFGLNWDGVIDDDRVATYKVAPLTEPETEVIWG